ncbi:DUF1565 domain-containing protein [Roseofilum reptotaenium CS-1145]|uniref:DUF1565 domain-containing protein n=1 Tax=Roseofilum reptotaenium TaxID=1233427 RepID=UPI000B059251|nr:DUF1565 domain-containing protein [Roseofilum reptotaenium]MDB9515667.1 DUF1565 domain-containing protein [Roseofilum reptotaenium CS-1145]
MNRTIVNSSTVLFTLLTLSLSTAIAPKPVLASESIAQLTPGVSTERPTLWVNPQTGNDQSGNGTSQAPYRTLTYALRMASTNHIIQLSAGTYSQQTGEVFPIQLKPNVIVVGNPDNKGQNVIIQGGGRFISPTFARQNITLLGANDAALAGVTVTNPNGRGYGLWIESSSLVVADNTFTGNVHDGISITGRSGSVIRSNHFTGNGANGMTIYGTSNPEVRDNVFDNTGFGININQNATPLIINNQIINNRDGVVVQAKATPILRDNRIENNRRNGLVAISESQPNLGTSNEPGNNQFSNNGEYDINAQGAKNTIPAYGNQLITRRIAGRLDFQGTAALIQSAPENSRPSPPPLLLPTPSRPVAPPPTNNSPTPAPIPIPVPPPQSRTPLPAPPAPQQRSPLPAPNRSSSVTSQVPNLDPLPVPNIDIPLGDNRYAGRIPNRASAPGTPPPPPTSVASALGLRYRVIVYASSTQDQNRVKSVVPDAFRSSYQGRSVLQVGAFATVEEAQDRLELVRNTGVRAELVDY